MAVSRRTRTLRVRPTLAERDMHRALETYARKVRTEHGAGRDPAHLGDDGLDSPSVQQRLLARSLGREEAGAALDGDGSSRMPR